MKQTAHHRKCGHHVDIDMDNLTGYCPLCDEEITIQETVEYCEPFCEDEDDAETAELLEG